jgi:hypothetical protein
MDTDIKPSRKSKMKKTSPDIEQLKMEIAEGNGIAGQSTCRRLVPR